MEENGREGQGEEGDSMLIIT